MHNCFPRDQSLRVLLYSWKFNKPRFNGGHRSTFVGHIALLPSEVVDVARSEILAGNSFTVSCHVTSK